MDNESFWKGGDQTDYAAKRQETYESTVVKHALKYTPLKESVVRSAQRRIDGSDRLTLEAFAQTCTDFPLTLVTKKLPDITPGSWLVMLNAPTKSRIYDVYAEAAVEHPDAHEANCLALVFSWPKWSEFVLFHNHPMARYDRGIRTVWYIGRDHKQLVLETMESFFLALGIGRAAKTAEDS